jgi:GNAT superfamily N-acetyltransferase
MEIVIRKGTEKDFAEVLAMIHELADFEQAPDAVTNTVVRMKKESSMFDFFIAEVDGKVAGMALYFFAYYTWVGKSMYLDDIFVRPKYRGLKISSKLLKKVFEVAKAEDCHRLRWQVLDWNSNAIEIYKAKGAAVSNEWLNCDYDREGILNFLENN